MKNLLFIILTFISSYVGAQVKAPGVVEVGSPKLLDRSNWTVTSSSGQRPESAGQGLLSNLFDGLATTYWTSNYGNTSINVYPHVLTIDMSTPRTYKGILIYPRRVDHAPKNITIEKSNNNGNTWEFVSNVLVAGVVKAQYLDFGSSHTSQYIRITMEDNQGSNKNAALFELGLYNEEFEIPDNTAYSRLGWAATGSSTNGGINSYTGAIDNEPTTIWHTRYQQPDDPNSGREGIVGTSTTSGHFFEVDMKNVLTINKISLINRTGNSAGDFVRFNIRYKINANDAWTTLSQNGTNIVYSSLELGPAVNNIVLPQTIAAQYIKLEIIETNGYHAMLAEFRVHYDETLPVELTSFTAKANTSSVGLNWTTATEKNADYFNIARSSDLNEFVVIGKINAAGNSNTNKIYNFTDFSPLKGTNYYQLHQVDLDGGINLSDVISAKIAIPSLDFTIESVGTKDITLSVYTPSTTSGKIITTNILGQQISNIVVNLVEGYNKVNIVTGNDKGIIVVKLATPIGGISKKVIK